MYGKENKGLKPASGGAGRKISELVWTAVIGVAATGTAEAAQRPGAEIGRDIERDIDTELAEKKAGLGLAGMMAGAAQGELAADGQLPADIEQLIQAVLDQVEVEQGNGLQATSAGDEVQAAAVAGQTDGGGAHGLEPVYLAAAGSDSVIDAGQGMIDWSNSMQLAQADTAGGGVAVPGIEAADSSILGLEPSMFALLGGGALLVGGAAAAAGGGGGGDSGSSGSSTPTVSGLSGKAVDGYVAGGKVFVDANGDGQFSANEQVGVTDAQGNFQVTGSVAVGAKIMVQGGYNAGLGDGSGTITSLSNMELLGSVDADGHVIVSPLTTLLAKTPGLTEATLKEALGIPDSVDLNNFDPVAAIKANGADASVGETVFAKAQQVMTLMQTAVAAGVDLDDVAQTIGKALSTGDADTVVQAVVSEIGEASPAFRSAAAQEQLSSALDAINESIETAYSGLAEAVASGDDAKLADALAPTAVAQTSFLDAVVASDEQGQATGIAAFRTADVLAETIDAAAADIENHVQTLDVQAINELSNLKFDFSDSEVNIVVNDQADLDLLNTTLKLLGGDNVGGDLQIDDSLSQYQDQILKSLTTAGVDTSGINVQTGDY